jgi:hypothetical protein
MALIVAFRNLSNLAEVSDYEVKAFINETQIEQFYVRNHVRSQGAAELLRLAYWAWKAEPKTEPYPKEDKSGYCVTERRKRKR